MGDKDGPCRASPLPSPRCKLSSIDIAARFRFNNAALSRRSTRSRPPCCFGPLQQLNSTMASMRAAMRLAPRAQIVRPSAVSRIAALEGTTQRRYASVVPRPATDAKPASEVEQGSEDLFEDPNMVREDECYCKRKRGGSLAKRVEIHVRGQHERWA